MPKCINNDSKYYTGNEKSPMGLGYCSLTEEIGKRMKGKDSNMWVVKKVSDGKKRWVKFIEKEQSKIIDANTIISNNPEIESSTNNSVYLPEFYHVVYDIFPEYDEYNSANLDYDDYIEKIKEYIIENKFNTGDILFVGLKDDSLPRDEYGYCIVLENGNFELSTGLSSAGNLPLLNEDIIKILSNKVSYKSFFEKHIDDDFFRTSFLNEDSEMYDELKKEYEENNIW
jgi:hypothetical protein